MKSPNWGIWMNKKEECGRWLENYLKKAMLLKSKDESRLYLRKADHNLNLANWIMKKHKKEIPFLFGEENFYDWTISIFYYAVYHAALALVSREGYKSKSHSATLCFLIYHHYYRQKAINEEEVELLARSLDKEEIEIVGLTKEYREKASYDVHEIFERQLAEQVRGQAIEFINKIKSLLEGD